VWQDAHIQPLLRQVRLTLGILLGKASTVSAQVSPQAALDTLLQNIITSSAIEGETLNVQSLRSSLAKRLGLSDNAPYPTSERTEGLSNIMLDVVSNINSPSDYRPIINMASVAICQYRRYLAKNSCWSMAW
jgi:Fic family protein